jgi:glycosyltransferase involved in cell wall biosynthesis
MQIEDGPRTLILLANVFPFGDWEPFLGTELTHLRNFASVEVFSLSVSREHAKTRRTIENPLVDVHPVWRRPSWMYLLNSPAVAFRTVFWSELWFLVRTRAFRPARLVELVAFLSRALIEARDIKRALRGKGVQGERPIIYAYRFYYQPYLAHLVARSLKSAVIVARAHGADLYEEVSRTGYLPLRRWSVEHVERLWAVSEHGRRYLRERFPEHAEVFVLSCLGSQNEYGVAPRPRQRCPLKVVSCSSLVPVKRLDRLIRGLALLEPGSVEWTHYGDGPLRQELEALAGELLTGRIDYSFRGALDHAEILRELWQRGFHVFVNVSDSEGLPVSIMEACSFGIPVIATDVGGSGEIVKTGANGILLAAGASPETLAKAVDSIRAMADNEYLRYAVAARSIWEERFDATRSYQRFARELVAL